MDPVQDADPQSHEGFGEVDHLLSLRGDGEAGDRQVCFLQTEREREGGLTTASTSVYVITWTEEEEEEEEENRKGRQRIRSEGVGRRAEGGRETLSGRPVKRERNKPEPKNTREETTTGQEGEPTTTEEDRTGQGRLNVVDMNKRSVIMMSF